jgi:hypothetical protein
MCGHNTKDICKPGREALPETNTKDIDLGLSASRAVRKTMSINCII